MRWLAASGEKQTTLREAMCWFGERRSGLLSQDADEIEPGSRSFSGGDMIRIGWVEAALAGNKSKNEVVGFVFDTC